MGSLVFPLTFRDKDGENEQSVPDPEVTMLGSEEQKKKKIYILSKVTGTEIAQTACLICIYFMNGDERKAGGRQR